MKKKILALFLSFVLLLTAFPMGAFAADTGENSDEARVTVYITPDKTGNIAPGDLITYTVSMSWTVPMTAFQVDMVLPDGLEYVEGSGSVVAETRTMLEELMGESINEFSWIEETFYGGLSTYGFHYLPISMPDGYDKVDMTTFKAYVSDDATEENDLTVGANNFAMADENYEEITDVKVVNTAVPVIRHECRAEYLDKVETVAATCTVDGKQVKYCSVCGEIAVEEVIPATGHSWSDWSEPADGFKVRNCNTCGTEEKKSVEASDNISLLRPLRGTISTKTYKGEEYIAITMASGRTMTGIYKDMTDGGTVELVDICGTIQDRAGDYVAYQSQNETNPVATMKITYADGTTEVYPVVFELYEMEREISLDISKYVRPIRGTASLAEDEKGEYILIEMNEGQSSVGVYKATADGSATATLISAEGMHTEQEKLYIFYGSQNTFNPEGRLEVAMSDGTTGTYRVVFKMYEMNPYVNAAKGLRPIRGAVLVEADDTIRIKMTKGQTSVGLYKTTANGATFEIVDANGKLTNNASSLMFYMTNNPANVAATIIFTLPDGTTKEQKIIFDMGLEDNPEPFVYLTAVRGTVSYKDDYIEVKANEGSTGVGLSKDCIAEYMLTDVDGVMTENNSRYYIYKSQNPDGVTANINFIQSDGSYKTYTVKFVF